MKQKIANYSIILMVFVALFGLYQAYNQNRAPFRSMSDEPSEDYKYSRYGELKQKNSVHNNDRVFRIEHTKVFSDRFNGIHLNNSITKY